MYASLFSPSSCTNDISKRLLYVFSGHIRTRTGPSRKNKSAEAIYYASVLNLLHYMSLQLVLCDVAKQSKAKQWEGNGRARWCARAKRHRKKTKRKRDEERGSMMLGVWNVPPVYLRTIPRVQNASQFAIGDVDSDGEDRRI